MVKAFCRIVSSWRYTLLPYALLVIIHASIGFQGQQPHIFADELGYLGNARYLAGTSHLPDMRGTTFYHFGYSLFLIPAFWLSVDPILTYKLVLLTNALLLSSLYFALYALLQRVFAIPKKPAMVIAFVSCCYPAFVLQSNVAWAENVLIPGYAFLIVAFGALIRHKSYRAAAVFGLLTGFLYTSHPRNLVLLPIACVHLSVLTYRRIVPPLPTLLSIMIAVLVWGATRALNSHLKHVGWGGHGEFAVFTILARAFSFSTVENWSLLAAGQIFYLMLATYGLVLIGVGYGMLSLYKDSRLELQWLKNAEIRNVIIFLFSTSFGLFLASTLPGVTMGGPTRGDHWFYGRYNEEFLAPYIALALTGLYRKNVDEIDILSFLRIPVIAVLGGLALFLFVRLDEAVYTARFALVNVLGIYPVVGLLGKFRLDAATLGALLAFVTLVYGFRRTFGGGVILLLSLFLATTCFGYVKFFRPLQRRVPAVTTLAAEVQKLGNVTTVSYDMSFHNVFAFYSYQYLLPHVTFERFASRQGEIPKSAVVISGKKWSDAAILKARAVALEKGIDLALWVRPDSDTVQAARTSSYVNRKLGAEKIVGVEEQGFHGQEQRGDQPVRWTNGAAKLVVPVQEQWTILRLKVDLARTGPKGTQLRIRVNGQELRSEQIPPGPWTRVVDLTNMKINSFITIELLSDTFVPKKVIPGSADVRTLGVVVRGIWLLDEEVTPEG